MFWPGQQQNGGASAANLLHAVMAAQQQLSGPGMMAQGGGGGLAALQGLLQGHQHQQHPVGGVRQVMNLAPPPPHQQHPWAQQQQQQYGFGAPRGMGLPLQNLHRFQSSSNIGGAMPLYHHHAGHRYPLSGGLMGGHRDVYAPLPPPPAMMHHGRQAAEAAPLPKFVCNICNIECNSSINLDQHFASRKHQSKAARCVMAILFPLSMLLTSHLFLHSLLTLPGWLAPTPRPLPRTIRSAR